MSCSSGASIPVLSIPGLGDQSAVAALTLTLWRHQISQRLWARHDTAPRLMTANTL